MAIKLSACRHVPVLIIGAGPTGLLSANLLGLYGIQTLVVERNQTTSDHPKAILIDDEGLRVMQTVGLADEILERVIAGYGARYYDSDGQCFAEVSSPVTQHGYPRRNAFLQPELERILLDGLKRFPHVQVMFETELAIFEDRGDVVNAQLKPRSDDHVLDLTCDFILACDGARSTVRERLNVPMPGMTDPRDWVVIDTVNDPDRDRFSKFFCNPKRPMVSIPAPRGGRRYEFMIMPGEDPSEMQSRATIRSMLDRFRDIPDEDIVRAAVYTFHARVAARFVKGRIALLGDAAHLSPPFAGQGMNAGLRDAFNMAWKVELVLKGMASEQIIETYDEERKGPVTDMVDYAVALGEIVMPLEELDHAAKEIIAANLADRAPSSSASLKLRPKPEAYYQAGWRISKDAPSAQGLTGRPFPQISVEASDGQRFLLDDVLGPGFSLIAIDQPAVDRLIQLPCSGTDLPSLKKVALFFHLPLMAQDHVQSILASGNDFGLRGHPGSIFLIRPDRFIAAHWPPGNAIDIGDDLSSLFGQPDP